MVETLVIDHTQLNISPNDKIRQYRHITLKNNQLQCLLISDPSTDKSAACCDVHVGSMLDPVLAPGLAHFLEHMLFMGTEKYPDENAYQAYLSSHGGASNAYTDQENTVYYFDVQPDYFEGALDIFASFFTCPSFNVSSTNREMKAVDSENSKNLQSDMWRSYQLFKSLAKPDHPFSFFSTGNIQTLQELPENSGVNVRELLLEYYNNYYSSNIMKLCVYGKEDLDTLQNWVIEKFSLIPDRNVTIPSFPSDPYGPEQLSKLVHMIPIRDTKSLEISFLLPSTSHLYRSKPSKYLSHLIGHESEGSILAALKSKGLANSLSASTSNNCKDFSLLDITIELSDEGTSHIDDCISCVFAYIGILKREGAKEWIAKEIKDINDLNYKFLEKSQPTDYVTRLANSMQLYEPIDTIQSTYTVLDIDISNISVLVDRLKPNNCIILYKNKQVITSKKEHWYGTDYEDYRFTNEQIDQWNSSLQGDNIEWLNLLGLPKPNPFIPNEFTIRSEIESKSDSKNTIGLLNRESFGLILDKSIYKTNDTTIKTVDSTVKSPLEDNIDDEEDEDIIENKEVISGKTMDLYSSKSIQSWFKLDDIWKVPLLNVVLSVETSQSSSSPFGVVMSDLLQQVLKELLSEYSYYADCAGLHYTIQLSKSGLEFLFYGYHDKLPVLVYKTLEELKTLCSYTSQTIPTNVSDIFNRMKEKTLRTYYNNLFWQPYYHCIMGTSICCEDPRWTSAEKYQALSTASIDDFISFNRIFIQTLKLEVSIHGNATADEAKKISNEIVRIVNHKPLSSSQESIRRAVKFEPNTTYIYRQHAKHYNPEEVNSGIENVYYVTTLQGFENDILDNKRIELEAQIELVVQMISDKAFDQLRTKEQLGYVVFTGVKKLVHESGLHIIVQSNHKDPEYLDSRIESFLSNYYIDLTNDQIESYIKDEELVSYKQAIIEKLLEKPKNLSEESKQLLEEIRQQTYLFDRKTILANYLSNKFNEPSTIRSTVKEFFEIYLSSKDQYSKSKRSKFSSQFYGKNHLIDQVNVQTTDKIVIIDDPIKFKRGVSLCASVSYDSNYVNNSY